MSEIECLCFVIMPFKPELYYFYLFIKQHIEKRSGLLCERADAQYLAKPIPDKIYDYIQRADVIIADCSDSNANVFYEIGMAYALNKKVILITSDSYDKVPFDVKHYEILHYGLDEHKGFLSDLDNALDNVFSERYEKLYEAAKAIFRKYTPGKSGMASKDEFISRVKLAEPTQDLRTMDDELEMANFVLPRIVSDPSNPAVMKQVLSWLESQKRRRRRTR